MHMPYSDARLDHLPTSAWPWSSHSDTRISHLEIEHKHILTKLDELETKLDTFCNNKTDDPSGTRNSPSTETDTEGGDTEHDSTPHSTTAHKLREDMNNLRQKAEEFKTNLEASRQRFKEKAENLEFDSSKEIREKEAEYKKMQEQIHETQELFEKAHSDARTAGEPPILHPRTMLGNATQSRYAVRIPR